MPFEVKILRDSISLAGKRLLSAELYYPRVIHAEAKTYRKMRIGSGEVELLQEVGFMDDPNLARNASSSRAIPVNKLIEEAIHNPAVPIYWGKNQPGMQAREELSGAGLEIVKEAWFRARDAAVAEARIMAAHGAHKQTVNRILEPYTHIRVIVTATDWANFFAQRRHKDAQPEIKHLADLLWDAMQASTPTLLRPGQWHLPYITEQDYDEANTAPDETLESDPYGISRLIKVSTARCARVSYRLHDGRPTTLEEDLRLYESLVGAQPMHASPAEHQATPDDLIAAHEGPYGEWRPERWARSDLHGPFTGWVQHRKLLPGENITEYQGVH